MKNKPIILKTQQSVNTIDHYSIECLSLILCSSFILRIHRDNLLQTPIIRKHRLHNFFQAFCAFILVLLKAPKLAAALIQIDSHL